MNTTQSRSVGNVAVIDVISPRMSAASAVKFREEVLAVLASGHSRLVINLDKVEIIDSSGLGVIVSVMKTVGGSDNIVLCGVCPLVMGVFKLTRMERIFRIVDTVPAALKLLAQNAPS